MIYVIRLIKTEVLETGWIPVGKNVMMPKDLQKKGFLLSELVIVSEFVF